ncbi:tRNA pseudouridine synthase B [Dokdonia sp. Hel_I_63]|uniref:tRNA pseudouridine(55) synthase TruB n=1 Tax=unclassified Dokdonia TaxID=2615033 RepID=UPI00020A76D2|nr:MULTISPECIES: tRNA pseudouridine(55) synthase TruB [unclassified Dokdonia]AEE19245.1 tRNA pseudouridine synthase B [Dokdonia sp. 4H-3-7-5]TVZ21518.1 tRNA pseudouridine synthase B [Dokdonia sp. Hel_I_63]
MLTDQDYKDGQVLIFDKPLEWTSFQLVNKVRWLIRKNLNIKKIKVGHAGTLDPLATGLMIICTGKFTKRLHEFVGQEKEYTGTIVLGGTTPSYDLETEVDQTFSTEHITDEDIYAFAKAYQGNIMQRPPVFSALKKEGKRLYEFARAGEEVDISKREINISSFEITRIAMPEVDFKVRCSKGTYIRSLAFDFGEGLKSGAHLSALRRTKIGNYNVDDAQSLDGFIAEITAASTEE